MDDTRIGELYEGHIPLDDALATIELSRYQKIEIRVLVALLSIIRPVYWRIRRLRGRPFAVADGLDELRDMPSPTRGSRTKETDGGDYLSPEQIAEYERSAVLGPLPLLSPKQADDFRTFVQETHAADWHGKFGLGIEAVNELKKNKQWTVDHGAIWQERNFEEFRNIATHPVLAQRVASLLGDEVVAWRTQVFEVRPGQKGTFWHTATTFTEDGDRPALSPPADIPASMVNLTCWIALQDVGPENACLRIVPGSHDDGRLDAMLQRFARDRVGFLMSFKGRDLERALMALRYSGDIFLVVQLAFDLGMSLVPDLYETRRPQSYSMKAGEALFFSSNNLHGSFPNSSTDGRYAMVIRFTSADVGIFEDQPTIPYNTGSGTTDMSTAAFDHGIPVHTAAGPVVTEVSAPT